MLTSNKGFNVDCIFSRVDCELLCILCVCRNDMLYGIYRQENVQIDKYLIILNTIIQYLKKIKCNI